MNGELANKVLEEILEAVYDDDIGDEVFDQARINYSKDMSGCSLNVAFSKKCVKKMEELSKKTKETNSEYGTFFYGKIKDKIICITDYCSDFETCDGEVRNGGVKVTSNNLEELRMMTEKTNANPDPYTVVIHFHTHPIYAYNKSGQLIKPNTLKYSEQDLFVYSFLQKHFQPDSNRKILFFGGLLAIQEKKSQISVVFYHEENKDIYNISNLFYEKNDGVCKFDITENKDVIKLAKKIKEQN